MFSFHQIGFVFPKGVGVGHIQSIYISGISFGNVFFKKKCQIISKKVGVVIFDPKIYL